MVSQKIGLVLEGGGMRGAYTSGVLDAFMDEKIEFPYVIGVSAGANNGADFVAGQRDRNKKVFVDIVEDKRYLGLANLIKKGSYFGMDFLFDEVPNKIVPFDHETFYKTSVIFKVCVTACETGTPVYYEHKDYPSDYFIKKILRASCSLPIVSRPVEIDGREYMDGGMVDPIPLDKSIKDGNAYNVIVLTRNSNYRKTSSRLSFLRNVFLCKYPQLVKALQNRPAIYNACLDRIIELEKAGKVFVFRPEKELKVDRFEKDITKLHDLYEQGYQETMKKMQAFRKWVNRVNEDCLRT